ncbi:FERM domain-containing protein 8 [Culex pipiens pallens]|uniref:FERM domain-containing protein 8 n=1 Tax=Culex pipiens pallens TaxID=42434 RepID=UPI0019535E36|nr:FERM domain-containing protein 8 [Culex pipiens pallens]XP_039446053.1 FERM domain-containing protein 8 [Culex pipiens pallens]XP_039446054.1 FERM domain-containing protein 8 [Culex pipiens pallens]
MPVGNVPYHHRRKYSPQVPPDYQSRIFFGDYMRENRPSRVAGGSGHVGTSTVAAPAAAGTQLSNSGASSGEEQQYSSSAASSVAQDNAGSVNNFPGGLQQQQQQHNGNGPTSPVSGSQISLGQQQRVANNNNNIAVIGGLAGSGSLSTAAASGNNCCAGSGGTAGVAGCDTNGNDDGCAELQFHHQSSPGPTSSTNSYTIGGSTSGVADLQQQQQQQILKQQQTSQPQQQQQHHQLQQQQQLLQQSSSLSSSNSLINNNNQIRDNYGVTTSAIVTLGSGGSVASNSNNNHHQQQQQQFQGGVATASHHVSLVGVSAASSATMTTSAAISPPRPMQKVIPTVVYLMSRIAVHMEIEGTAQCPAQVMLAAALGCEELGITNKLLAQSVFGLWMTSPLLEVQLKPHHRPYAVRVAWSKLLDKHSHGNELEKLSDEPMTMLRRNVFFSKRDEEKIKDPRILELLYEEARHNVLLGRYVMESSHSIMLGGIQARIELGPYNSHTHSTSYFRENQFRFLPAHVAKSSSWSWLPISRRTSAEVRLLEQFKRVPTTATTKKLMRKYLEFCWALPFYGAAYFHGQVEQPVRGLMSLMQQKDLPVLIAVNERGIYVIDQIECTLLLGLKYDELSWDYAKPSNVNDPECLPCIFLQFGAVENGIAATKLMQIFTRQAAMVDALITHFIEQAKRRKESGGGVGAGEVPDVPIVGVVGVGGGGENPYEAEPNPIQNNGVGVLSNKLSRLTLATFDDEGRCIGQTGSLAISY